MKDIHYVSDQWADYKRRKRMFLWLFAACLPVGILAVYCLNTGTARVITAILTLLWVTLFSIATIRLQLFPCPNCGKPFSFKYINNLPLFVKSCVHCGVRKWEH